MFVNAQPADVIYIDTICLQGNKITKRNIILRELTFQQGDSLSIGELTTALYVSRNNLMNTSLFNFVEFDTTYIRSQKISVTITFTERWFIWVLPAFGLQDRNFNAWLETKDLKRFYYGLYLDVENFRGRRENTGLLVVKGYDELYGVYYKIPFLNKQKTIGLNLACYFSGKKELEVLLQENKMQSIFNAEDYLAHSFNAYAQLAIRKRFFNKWNIKTSFQSIHLEDTVFAYNPIYWHKKSGYYSSYQIWFQSDHRDYKAYPLQGYCFDFFYDRYGLPIIERKTIDANNVLLSVKKYRPVKNRWFVAGELQGRAFWGSNEIFQIRKSLGYHNDFVRSYEPYVFEPDVYLLEKFNIKYQIIAPKITAIRKVKNEKFSKIPYSLYANAFVDAAYLWDETNQLLAGSGLGIDLSTYYDKVIRIEFSINRKKEAGIYIHFLAPI